MEGKTEAKDRVKLGGKLHIIIVWVFFAIVILGGLYLIFFVAPDNYEQREQTGEVTLKVEDNRVLMDTETCGLSAEEVAQLFGREQPELFSQAECIGLQMRFKEYYRQKADNCQKQLDDLLGVHAGDPGE